MTGSADPCAFFADVGVGGGIEMAVRTARPSGFLGGQGVSSKEIDSARHQFEMFRPDTTTMGATHLANVVPIQARGRFTNEKVVSLNVALAIEEPAIPFAQGTDPQGAAISTARINLPPKSNSWCDRLMGHRKDLLSVSKGGLLAQRRPFILLERVFE